MKIKWLGHSSFLITSDTGLRIITDPYEVGGGLSYGQIKESADIVIVSHDHADHNNVAAVQGNPKVVRGTVEVKGIKFKGIPTYHDEAGGGQRGRNTILCFEVDGMRLCHLGDLGHQLSDSQAADLGKIDILFIPVGGFYTIDAKVATQLCDRLKPKVVIPMHYKIAKCAYPITGVEEFLRGKKEVNRLDSSQVEFKTGQLPATTKIIVLKPAL
jgi:L-ascorbate metabolism protein UlaG (beta-lactamase superfamily)